MLIQERFEQPLMAIGGTYPRGKPYIGQVLGVWLTLVLFVGLLTPLVLTIVRTGSTTCEGGTLSHSFLASSIEEDAQDIFDTIVPLSKSISYGPQFYVFFKPLFFLSPTGHVNLF